MATTGRIYLYGIALVALGMLVTGLADLVRLALEVLAQPVVGTPAAIGPDQLRSRVSFAGALAGTGLVAWLVHWTLANRPLRRGDAASAAERRAAIRKLFLYLALFVG